MDLAKFADEPIQAIDVTVPAGPQVKELWIRATLTLDQPMKSGGQGAFTFGETEDYFYAGPGPTPKHKGKHKKKKGKKGAPESLEVDCFSGFMNHGTTQSFSLFFTDPDTGAWVNPAPGSVDVQVANGQKGAPAVPGDVSVKPFSYGYKVTSKLKDDRANPFEPVFVLMDVTSTKPGERVDAGRWSLGLPTNKGVVLSCFVLILHSHHVPPGGGPPGGGPPGGPGQPGGPGGPGSGQPSNQAPTAAFTFTPNNPPTGPKAGQAVDFDGSGSSDPDGTVVAWSWTVGATLHGGGGTSNVSGDGTPHATIRFPTAGIYPVTLTVTDNGGKTSSVTQNVAVSSAGLKSEAFATDPMDVLGCSGMITAMERIFIPTYAQTPMIVQGPPTGDCMGATITITKITRQSSNAPPDDMGNPRLDEWGNVKDTVLIEFTISGGTSARGTVPFSVSWQ